MEQTRPMWKSMILGAVISLIVMLLLSILAALLIGKSVIPEQSVAVAGIIIALLASFAGSVAAGRMQKGKLLVTCFASAAIYLGCLVLIKAAFFGAWNHTSMPMALGILGCGVVASFVPTGARSHRKRR
ncbi:MAG: TIGR04086 family membrane protein [Ruminococcaceae bacterium]|nr:TIGR04086 family membrane protein [Oscillospiraceae bacterium]